MDAQEQRWPWMCENGVATELGILCGGGRRSGVGRVVMYVVCAGRTQTTMSMDGLQDFCSGQILSTCIHGGRAVNGDIELHPIPSTQIL
jgi:hypothetical protein